MSLEKPVPSNIVQVPKMHDFMNEIFKERTKSKLQVEAIVEKIQNKARDIYLSMVHYMRH